ncbi:glutaredoxin family protein [Undibacterium sp. SXout7W]|uniref:glutaredoxin family protein n=1 Tax=Undibacterium sp. SXout7W TaxID=3413049 RepID=UPI003BF1C09C
MMTLPVKTLTWIVLPMTLLAVQAHAELYKWVGPDGKVNYSDRPPADQQKNLEKKALPEIMTGVALPPDLAAAVAQNPVTLYTADNCNPCNDGRNLLKTNGIPFAEKTIKTNEDINKLRQVSGDSQVPFVAIGPGKLFGLDSEAWKNALTSAGYPSTNKLPKEYHYPAAEPAAPVTPVTPKTSAPASSKIAPAPLPVKKPTNDNGFRF